MPKQLNLYDELIIDNFAGGGGASTGIELAVSRPVDIAINHDSDAIAMHKANHPYTKHYCERVWDVDPLENSEPFVVQVNHSDNSFRGQPVSEPLPTLTAKHGLGIVTPYIIPNNENNVPRGVREPVGTVTKGNRHYLVAPVLAYVGGRTGQSRPRTADEPAATITAKADVALIAPTLIQYHREQSKNETHGQALENR